MNTSDQIKKNWIKRRANGNATPWNKKERPAKELLQKLYVEERMGTREISSILSISQMQVCRLLKEFEISSRSFKENITPIAKGSHLSEAHRKNISIASIGKVGIRGEKHYNWRGGLAKESKKIRNSTEYKIWRKSVFERDNYTCTNCNVRGGYLEADHIKPFSVFHDLRFDINNGRTLCRKCHLIIGWQFFKENNPRKK